ncbi:uncharacterized protein LOC135697344, partial [Ochlerotatus camptorhynchus]|uniref:uncharacterized protein LOC135697344 n=1 Tax=Ochlerotatus camptorhynchus TaxID=644619 RepID=UPI0031D758A8
TALLLPAHEKPPPTFTDIPEYVISKCGTVQLRHMGHLFNRHVKRDSIIYWRCSQFAVFKCRARIKTVADEFVMINVQHNHEVVTTPRSYGSLKRLKQTLARVENKETKI